MRFFQKGQAEVVIIVLVAALGFILVDVLAFMGKQNLPNPVSQTVISFNPGQLSLHKGEQQQSVDITIDTGENRVTMVDLELAYTKGAIDNIQITPGSFFSDVNIIKDSIDPDKGTISYFIATKSEAYGVQGADVLATLTYDVPAGDTSSQATILPLLKTVVVDPRIRQSVLKQISPFFIYFN